MAAAVRYAVIATYIYHTRFPTDSWIIWVLHNTLSLNHLSTSSLLELPVHQFTVIDGVLVQVVVVKLL